MKRRLWRHWANIGFCLDGMSWETFLTLTVHDRLDIAIALNDIVQDGGGPLLERPKTLNRKLF